jgi:hypothetical protein
MRRRKKEKSKIARKEKLLGCYDTTFCFSGNRGLLFCLQWTNINSLPITMDIPIIRI